MTSLHDLREADWRHEPWAVTLRRFSESGLTHVHDRQVRDAVDQVLTLMALPLDCTDCEDAFFDSLPQGVIAIDEIDDVLAAARTDGAYAALDLLRSMHPGHVRATVHGDGVQAVRPEDREV